jgi:lysozyme
MTSAQEVLVLRFLRRLGAAVVVGVTVTAVLAPPASAAVVGADVSNWQHAGGRVSWTAAAHHSRLTFTFIKATEGSAYRNPYFHADWRASSRAHLLHGAYHFARPSAQPGSAVAQARSFVRFAGRMQARGVLPPALDLESTGGLSPARLTAWTRTWLETVHALTGRTPIIYSYPHFWRHAMAGTRSLRRYPLWGASYGLTPTTLGGAWQTWTFWQYSNHGHVHGIRGGSDVNRFHGSLARLRAMANIPPPRHRARPRHQVAPRHHATARPRHVKPRRRG